jgi:hypothetical protein
VAEIPDDKLMAYADGAFEQLTAFERGQIETALRNDAGARRRFEAFRATGPRISALFATAEPVPAHLKDFVLNYPIYKNAAPARRRAIKRENSGTSVAGALGMLTLKVTSAASGASEWLAGRVAPPARWQVAAVMASAFLVAPAIGWLAHRSADPNVFVTFQDGRVLAAGPLHRVLEELPSKEELRIAGAAASDAVTMRASLTFKTKSGWCREYDMSASRPDESFVGLGCRDADGRWSLSANLPSGASKKGGQVAATPAGGPEALDTIVDRIMVGDALGESEEAAAISRGWK